MSQYSCPGQLTLLSTINTSIIWQYWLFVRPGNTISDVGVEPLAKALAGDCPEPEDAENDAIEGENTSLPRRPRRRPPILRVLDLGQVRRAVSSDVPRLLLCGDGRATLR